MAPAWLPTPPGSGPMSAEDWEGWGPILPCSWLSPIPDSLPPWQRVFLGGDYRYLIFSYPEKDPFCPQVSSRPCLSCLSVSCWPKWGETVLHIKVAEQLFLWAPAPRRLIPNVLHPLLTSSLSTHNLYKREGFGIHSARIWKGIKRPHLFLVALTPLSYSTPT